jgi:DNA-binding NtrC family response regulator
LRILIVDDEDKLRRMLKRTLAQAGYEVAQAADGAAALERLRQKQVDLVLSDIRMPGMDGLELLSRIKRQDPGVEVIMMTAYASVETAVKAMKQGATDYVGKPFNFDELLLKVAQAAERKRLSLRWQASEDDARELIGDSPAMRRLRGELKKIAAADAAVLISGESGTGKELVAQSLHRLSPRREGQLVAVNCAALAESLLESELFGHERGAFTGAEARKKGKFELADGGSIFLDEVGEMSPGMQAKLLRVLEQGEFSRVGGVQEIEVDVRVIAATNRRLEEDVEGGGFRRDLYHRLRVVPVAMPPLRERTADIPLLVEFFLAGRSEVPIVVDAVMSRLQGYSWPGNVRELFNLLERWLVLKPGAEICSADLPPEIASGQSGGALAQTERELISGALRENKGNQTRAAAQLGISRRTLIYRMKKHRLASRRSAAAWTSKSD